VLPISVDCLTWQPSKSAGFSQGEGKTHQREDQTSPAQPYARHPASSFPFAHSQSFLPTTSSFPSQEKPLPHTPHIFPSAPSHQVPPHFSFQNQPSNFILYPPPHPPSHPFPYSTYFPPPPQSHYYPHIFSQYLSAPLPPPPPSRPILSPLDTVPTVSSLTHIPLLTGRSDWILCIVFRAYGTRRVHYTDT
jgi:hypothetical protein